MTCIVQYGSVSEARGHDVLVDEKDVMETIA